MVQVNNHLYINIIISSLGTVENVLLVLRFALSGDGCCFLLNFRLLSIDWLSKRNRETDLRGGMDAQNFLKLREAKLQQLPQPDPTLPGPCLSTLPRILFPFFCLLFSRYRLILLLISTQQDSRQQNIKKRKKKKCFSVLAKAARVRYPFSLSIN